MSIRELVNTLHPIFSKHHSNLQKLSKQYCHKLHLACISTTSGLISLSQTKLLWKAPNKSYLHICEMYKNNNKQPRYQAISNYKSFVG